MSKVKDTCNNLGWRINNALANSILLLSFPSEYLSLIKTLLLVTQKKERKINSTNNFCDPSSEHKYCHFMLPLKKGENLLSYSHEV